MDAITGGWKVHIQYSLVSRCYEFTFYRNGPSGMMEFLECPQGPLIVHAIQEGAYRPDIMPTLRLDEFTVRNFTTALAEEKIKPNEATKTEGLLEAQTKHLDDMRNILKKQGVMG